MYLSSSFPEAPGLKPETPLNFVSTSSPRRETPIYKSGAKSAYSPSGHVSSVKIVDVQDAIHVRLRKQILILFSVISLAWKWDELSPQALVQ